MNKLLAAAMSLVAAMGGLVSDVLPSPGNDEITCDATDEAIYGSPEQVEADPGVVLACAASDFPEIVTDIPITAWKVRYASTDVHGTRVPVSGLVAVPEAEWRGEGPRPVVAFNPGTVGLGTQCAYSKQMAGNYTDAYERYQLAAALEAGYAVAATDGVGYLDGQVHSYMVGDNSGRALLDVARAATSLPAAGLAESAQVGLWGYSEGGQAALWATQLAGSYAGELDIVGAAAGGVPGDLRLVAGELNGGDFAGFAGAALVGFHVTYPEMPFDELLNDTGREAVAALEGSCLIDTIFDFRGARIEDFNTDGLGPAELFELTGPDGVSWGEIADRQKLGVGIGTPGSGAEHEIAFPTFQYRGKTEQIIPVETEEATMRAYCAAGVPTRWRDDIEGDHLGAARAVIPDVLDWFADRLAGEPEPGDCG
ncbi:lipase family protein [Amycolatopsis cihanbeyliensis]|uniref:Triacylglycerol lipase n=1 Tax=Amycolatopsis cihanbeyliensis TaxID=1128664 RepID=A0A542DQZ0_AMYCI|nr:lipase family protein [Amycolatopsis cihanbeyliensis]TQJ05522.1 triacylglycerol lipase [Amycolatopsis cihanbeyliensis]